MSHKRKPRALRRKASVMSTPTRHVRYQIPGDDPLCIETWFVREGDFIQPGQPLAQFRHPSGLVAILRYANKTATAYTARVHQVLLPEGARIRAGHALVDICLVSPTSNRSEAPLALTPTLECLPASFLRDILFRYMPPFRLFYFRHYWLVAAFHVCIALALLAGMVMLGISIAKSLLTLTTLSSASSASPPGNTIWTPVIPLLLTLGCIVLGYQIALRLLAGRNAPGRERSDKKGKSGRDACSGNEIPP